MAAKNVRQQGRDYCSLSGAVKAACGESVMLGFRDSTHSRELFVQPLSADIAGKRFPKNKPLHGRGVTGFCALALFVVRTLAVLVGFFAGTSSLGDFFACTGDRFVFGFVSVGELGTSPHSTLHASSTWYDMVEVIGEPVLRYTKSLNQR